MDSQPPFSSLVSPAQLAITSVMAISAFYIHKRIVDQVLDRLLNLRRHQYISDSDAEDSDYPEKYEQEEVRNYRVSCSMPNVMLTKNEWNNEDSLDNIDLIPSNLPALQTDQRDGTFFFFENLNY
ncbi:AMP deaminase [Abeliophyllum distichum]|uniref:AMP deaminase n=1 Tax=Abeliophyllum distichum TaxID=126358 RepID=A0ABD1VSG7_9LAMI